jgi:hypothetical protein
MTGFAGESEARMRGEFRNLVIGQFGNLQNRSRSVGLSVYRSIGSSIRRFLTGRTNH